MVTLEQVRAGNARIATELPPGLVGVFAGATSGVGELALKGFAKHAARPKIYFIGRSQEAGARLLVELKELNAEGEYNFIKADVSLMKNVDQVCREIKEKEKVINVLLLSQGTLNMSGDTSEGLRYLMAVNYYSRMRMALNLLPLMEAAKSLRRIVSIQSAGFEGTLHLDHLGDGKIPLRDSRPHLASLNTLALEALARRSPTVSYIHNYPGFVKSNLIRPEDGMIMQVLSVWFKLTSRRKWVPPLDVQERHAWLCASGLYPDKQASDGNGAVVPTELNVVKGSDGAQGSGVYSIDDFGDDTSDRSVEPLRKHRENGAVDAIWKDLEDHFTRITGAVSV